MKRFLTLLKVCDIAQKTCEFAHTTHAYFLRGIEKRMNKIINIYNYLFFAMMFSLNDRLCDSLLHEHNILVK